MTVTYMCPGAHSLSSMETPISGSYVTSELLHTSSRMHPVEGRGLCDYLSLHWHPQQGKSSFFGRLLQQKHHRTRCHGNKAFSFSYFNNVLKVFRVFPPFSSAWPFSIYCASYAVSAMPLFFKTQTKNNPQNCSSISTDSLSAILPSYSLSLSYDGLGLLWQSNSETAICFV